MYKVIFSDSAKKDFKKINKADQIRIKDKIVFISKLESINSFAKKLNNFEYGDYRIRVGYYRLIFNLINRDIFITSIDHRKDVYK